MCEYCNQPNKDDVVFCVVCGDETGFDDACSRGWKRGDVDYTYYSCEGDQPYLCEVCQEEGHCFCCFCGEVMREPFTNNPWPANADDEARCCSDCDAMIVIPARMKMASEQVA